MCKQETFPEHLIYSTNFKFCFYFKSRKVKKMLDIHLNNCSINETLKHRSKDLFFLLNFFLNTNLNHIQLKNAIFLNNYINLYKEIDINYINLK